MTFISNFCKNCHCIHILDVCSGETRGSRTTCLWDTSAILKVQFTIPEITRGPPKKKTNIFSQKFGNSQAYILSLKMVEILKRFSWKLKLWFFESKMVFKKIGNSHFLYQKRSQFLRSPMSSLPLQQKMWVIFSEFPTKNVGTIFGIPMSFLRGVHLISGIAHYWSVLSVRHVPDYEQGGAASHTSSSVTHFNAVI